MKAIKLMYIPLPVTFIPIKGTEVKPCSTAKHLPVVNICSEETKVQDASNSVLIKADDKQNCTCELHVANQDQDVTVSIQKYDQVASSSPSSYGCGLILTFEIQDENWEAQCIMDNFDILMTIPINDVMKIRSLSVDGTLEPNEGYCIEVFNESAGNKLQLTCGINSAIENTTPTTSSKTTRSSTDMTTPIMTKYLNQLSTTTFETDELTLAFVTSTDVPVNTRKTNQQQNYQGIDEKTLYVAISVTVVGVATVIIVTILVLYYRRFRISSKCKNRTCSGANTIYDTLSLPSSVNVNDNTGISNNYSSLNVNDFQSPIDNRRLDETHIIPLSTISTGYGNNIMVMETERNTNKRNSKYANLVF